MNTDYEAYLDARQTRRMNAEDRALARIEAKERLQTREAGAMVGHLNSGKFYINVRNRKGVMTGEIKTFDSEIAAVRYLINNKYV